MNMLKNTSTSTLITKGNSELKKSKSLEIIQEVTPKVLVTRNSYHGSNKLDAKTTSQWNYAAMKRHEDEILLKDKMELVDLDRKKGIIIKSKIRKAELETKDAATSLVDSTHNTFGWALKHDCFYDIVSQDEEEVTIIFLPISTSGNKVSCGIQKFDKIHLFTSGFKDFYITRILFNITMTKTEFIKWEAESKLRYQNFGIKKIIFDRVQKDLDKNQYSVLKDKDFNEPNLDNLSRNLPLIKFKFTDLVE